MKILNFEIEKGKAFIIAKLSANHGHNIEIAKETIRDVNCSWLDAIRLENFTTDTITINWDNEYFRIRGGLLKVKLFLYYIRKPILCRNGIKNFLSG